MKSKGFLYYRERLPLRYRKSYDLIADGLLENRTEIKIGVTDDDAISNITDSVIADNPLIFYTNGFVYFQNPIFKQSVVRPCYHGISLSENVRILTDTVNFIAKRADKGETWDKLLRLHDILCKNIVYEDYGFYSHSAFGVAVNKKGVCDGISKLFKLCCDCIGLKCIVVCGKAKSEYGSASFDTHAWNKVEYCGNWYNIDVTFDTTISDEGFVRHDYFLVSDEEIISSHIEETKTEKCLASGEYYKKLGLKTDSPRDFYNLIVDRNDRGKEICFESQISGLDDAEKAERKIMHIIEIAMNDIGICGNITLSVNKERMTAFVRIKKRNRE